MHAKHEENWCPGRHSHAAESKCSCRVSIKVSVKGVKSLGCHFACLCRGFDFHEVKRIDLLTFFKKKREILLHF